VEQGRPEQLMGLGEALASLFSKDRQASETLV
jgi:hypothetical protein